MFLLHGAYIFLTQPAYYSGNDNKLLAVSNQASIKQQINELKNAIGGTDQ